MPRERADTKVGSCLLDESQVAYPVDIDETDGRRRRKLSIGARLGDQR